MKAAGMFASDGFCQALPALMDPSSNDSSLISSLLNSATLLVTGFLFTGTDDFIVILRGPDYATAEHAPP
jgi:hypothetical protein